METLRCESRIDGSRLHSRGAADAAENVFPSCISVTLAMSPLREEPAFEGDYYDQAQNHRDGRDREDGQRCR